MVEIFVAFVTGLTTGGLSCLAVQGGLLASSLANQIETSPAISGGKKGKTARSQPPTTLRGKALVQPILAFLSAKLVVYTLLGMLLGLVGSMFQLSPIARAVFQIAIAIFMIGSAMRMLNVHPIFRHFVFEPPAALRRFIRRKSNQESGPSLAAPLFLGALTVLIPCGVTQAMMAVALASGSPLQGAALMFAFTLGASPVFFAVAYFATQLGSRLEKHFNRFVAVVLLLLGLYMLDTGINLAGSPVSVTRLVTQITSSQAAQTVQNPGGSDVEVVAPAGDAQPDQSAVDAENVYTVKVVSGGYVPSEVHAEAGTPIRLRLVSKDVYTCALSFVIPSLNVQKSLQPTDEVFIDIPAQEQGSTIPFSCSMGMYTGKIVFDLEN